MKLIGGREEEKFVYISMEADPKVLKHFLDSRIFAAGQNLIVSGFRRGKAPLNMIISHLKSKGKWESIVEKVLNKVLDKTVEKVLADNKDWDKRVFGYPIDKKVLTLNLEEGVFTFEVVFEPFPHATIGDYSNIPTLIEAKDVEADFWPVLKEGEAGDRDVVTVTMEGRDSENNPVIKYCYDLLEVDMETTHLRREIVDLLKGSKVSDKLELVLKEGDLDINLKMTVLLIREKRPLDGEMAKFLALPENSTPEEIKKFVRLQCEMHNFAIRQRDLIKWILSGVNTLDSIPIENIKVEAHKLLNSKMREHHNSYSLEHAIFEQINNLRSSLVVYEIAKRENIEATEEDRKNMFEDMETNPWKYGLLTLDLLRKMDEESINHYVLQFKVLEFLSGK